MWFSSTPPSSAIIPRKDILQTQQLPRTLPPVACLPLQLENPTHKYLQTNTSFQLSLYPSQVTLCFFSYSRPPPFTTRLAPQERIPPENLSANLPKTPLPLPECPLSHPLLITVCNAKKNLLPECSFHVSSSYSSPKKQCWFPNGHPWSDMWLSG